MNQTTYPIQQVKIISAFPGCGKTFLVENAKTHKILDSDSTNFSWADEEKTKRNPNFPANYISHIESQLPKQDFILVSSHKEVRDAIVRANMHFLLVYPARELKQDYLGRYAKMGSDEKFVELLDKNWSNWLDELTDQKNCTHLILQKNQFLSNVLFGG